MNKSAKGRRREHFVRDRLLNAGFMVIRAAASKGIDLVATKPEASVVMYLSIKSNAWPPASELRALRRLARRCQGSPSGLWWVVVVRLDDRKLARCRLVYPVPPYSSAEIPLDDLVGTT